MNNIRARGLWSFSSSMVLANQDPTLSYTLAFTGYIGMAVSAIIIALKLIRGVEHHTKTSEDRVDSLSIG